MKIYVIGTLLVLGLAAAPRARAQGFRGEARVGVRIPAPTVRVRVAPPVARAELRVQSPSPRHVWAAGHWGWNRNRHDWVGGRWLLPPRPHAVYVSPRWVSGAGAWSYYPGYWQDPVVAADYAPEEVPQYDYAPEAVPQYDYIPVPPSPRHRWVRGDWSWSGQRRHWRPGYWELRGHGREVRHDWRRDHRHPGRWAREYSRRY